MMMLKPAKQPSYNRSSLTPDFRYESTDDLYALFVCLQPRQALQVVGVDGRITETGTLS